MPSIRCRFYLPAFLGASYLFCGYAPVHAQQTSVAQEQTVPLIRAPLVRFALSFDGPAIASPAAVLASVPASSPAPAPVLSSIRPVQTTVEVDAGEQTLREGLAAPYHVTRAEVLASAGTWGDFTRYLRVLPGTVGNTDQSNDVMVRGGHPAENLYVVDGIEVPNVNHLAVEGTTGGFTSMIDTSTIGSLDMKVGVYDASYSSRLSSLIEIHTRESLGTAPVREADLGIAGAGGFLARPVGNNGSLLLSAHRSILNLVTDDIGLNGVPTYTNGLARLELSPDKNDHLSLLSISGADSINIEPSCGDVFETLTTDTQYGGIRSTGGLIWQHTHSPRSVFTLTGSYTTQQQNIAQQAQSTSVAYYSCQPAPTTSVYQEKTRDSISTLGFNFQFDLHKWFFSTGTTGKLTGMNYAVAQPAGQQSPFSTNPAWTDADNFTRNFATGQTGTYAEVTGHIGARLTAIAGAREETFALTGATAFEPRASLAFRISDHQAVNGTYGRSAQLAPSIDLLSYAQNQSLRPLQVQQYSLGADLWRASWITASVESYRKQYSNEPVSTEYPSLMLANMVDTLGQQFVWLPLKSGGRGQAAGVELMLRAHWVNRVHLLSSLSYARTRYAAADGVMRSGNFDFPFVANALATVLLPKGLQLSVRNSYSTGRPYTPYNIPLSEQQSRGIYDLTQVNALRGPAYNRLDVDFTRNLRIHNRPLILEGGLENALDRNNFLGYEWMPRCQAAVNCNMLPETTVDQMPIFPSASIRYDF
jgi:hypothetical protein